MMARTPTWSALASAALLASCVSTTGNPGVNFDREGMLRDLADVVIIPSFQEAATAGASMHTAVQALCAAPSAGTLTSAQDAWRTAKRAWRLTDAFAFGPVEELQAKMGVDAWPAANVFVESAITSATTVDEASVHARAGNQRGYATLEYLLFGADRDNAAVVTALSGSAVRCQYAVAVAADVKTTVQAVLDAWRNQYRAEFTSAGKESQTYPTVKAAVDQVVNHLVVASEAIAGGRLAEPLGLHSTGTPEPSLAESPYSDNAIADMQAILDGIENMHRGRMGTQDALGVDDYLSATNAAVNTNVLREIAELRAGLAALPPPLRTAVTANTTQVQEVYQHARDVKRVFGTEVVAALGVTLVFNDNDGD